MKFAKYSKALALFSLALFNLKKAQLSWFGILAVMQAFYSFLIFSVDYMWKLLCLQAVVSCHLLSCAWMCFSYRLHSMIPRNFSRSLHLKLFFFTHIIPSHNNEKLKMQVKGVSISTGFVIGELAVDKIKAALVVISRMSLWP